MRKLSLNFMSDLKQRDGVLNPILERVKHDHTLMLAIRENYLNIYYRGGNILRLTEKCEGVYEAWFDDNYNENVV